MPCAMVMFEEDERRTMLVRRARTDVCSLYS